MGTYYKPQSPIQSGEDFIYPITTADQIMKSDNSRLEQNGEIVADNSPKLGGIAASEYALKTKTVPTSRTVNRKALSENITLSASDVGARPDTWMPSASDVGALPSGGTAADSSKLGGKAPEYYLNPRNLLDNSDFRNPVNQRGIYSAVAGSYIIDRWSFYNSNFTGNVTITQSANGITVTNDAGADRVAIVQRFIDKNYYDGKYTLVAKTTDGLQFGYIEVVDSENSIIQASIWLLNGVTIVWAAIYEGSYTSDTLPPYVPKGYAAEFVECRRYYKRFTAPYAAIFSNGYVTSSTKNIYINPPDNYPMRINKPSCTFTGLITVRGINGYIAENYSNAVFTVYSDVRGCISSLQIKRGDSAAWNATNNTPVAVQMHADSVLELKADL